MKRWMLAAGPLAGLLLFVALYQSGKPAPIAWTASITTWTAIWWIFEPIPIPATSLIPLSLLPLLGVLTPQEVGAAYGSPLILLLLGGFMLSSAMERSGAHRRIALTMVTLFGGSSARRLVFGFMAASAFLSMWISNTATTLMLLPIVLAVLENVDDDRLRVSLLLGVAYAASVGGTGTPVGTPPNLIFMEVYANTFGMHLGGTKTVYLYDDTEAYWHRVQILLDAFFTSRQRADITGALIEQDDLRTRPAFQPFLADALAERRLQGFFVTEIPADAGEGD